MCNISSAGTCAAMRAPTKPALSKRSVSCILTILHSFPLVHAETGTQPNPLDIKWMHTPVKMPGVHFSYDKKGNGDLNFSLKLRKLQTKVNVEC